MVKLSEKLRERKAQKATIETSLFGMQGKVLETVRQEVQKMKGEIKQELHALLKEALSEEGALTLKGERGFTPKLGSDFLTPADMGKIRRDAQGRNGRDGSHGEKGEKGERGVSGKAGNEISAPAIANKLNTLTGKVDQKVIRGFATLIRNINRSIRQKSGGGGGMPNVIHQSFAGDGSTTSFTLSSRVAANGTAIIVRYQGQTQDLTRHYTVSDTTLAMTFVPANKSRISVTYWRS